MNTAATIETPFGKLTLRQPRVIDSDFLVDVMGDINIPAVMESMGYPMQKPDLEGLSPEAKLNAVNEFKTEIDRLRGHRFITPFYQFACVCVLMERSTSSEYFVSTYPDMFQPSETITNKYIELYNPETYDLVKRAVDKQIADVIQKLYAPRMSEELAPSEELDPK